MGRCKLKISIDSAGSEIMLIILKAILKPVSEQPF